MTAAAAPPGTARGRAPRRWRRLREWQPQWWLWGVAAAGWLVLIGLFVAGLAAPAVGPAVHAGHGGHGPAPGGGQSPGPTLDPALGPHIAAGLAMVAVMAPLIAPNVRYAARRSPLRARGAVTVDVVAGWTLVWIGAAAALGAGGWLLAAAVGDLVAVGLATAVAVGWQHTLRKRLSLARCHALLAPPLDRRRSRRACRRYGRRLGRDCAQSCWPVMALMAVAAHNPLVVAASMGVAWYERRRRPHHDPATRPTSLAIAATGTAALAADYLLLTP